MGEGDKFEAIALCQKSGINLQKTRQSRRNGMRTNYVRHDSAYQKLKAAGAFGWTSAEDHTQVVRPRVLQVILGSHPPYLR